MLSISKCAIHWSLKITVDSIVPPIHCCTIFEVGRQGFEYWCLQPRLWESCRRVVGFVTYSLVYFRFTADCVHVHVNEFWILSDIVKFGNGGLILGPHCILHCKLCVLYLLYVYCAKWYADARCCWSVQMYGPNCEGSLRVAADVYNCCLLLVSCQVWMEWGKSCWFSCIFVMSSFKPVCFSYF